MENLPRFYACPRLQRHRRARGAGSARSLPRASPGETSPSPSPPAPRAAAVAKSPAAAQPPPAGGGSGGPTAPGCGAGGCRGLGWPLRAASSPRSGRICHRPAGILHFPAAGSLYGLFSFFFFKKLPLPGSAQQGQKAAGWGQRGMPACLPQSGSLSSPDL